LVRVGAGTGTIEGTVAMPEAVRPGPDSGHGGCFVGGRMPDAWWTWCFTEFGASIPVRIDPETLTVTGSVEVGGAVSGGVVVVGERSWFVANDRLIAVDARNVVTRVIGLGNGVGADNAILAADSLWIPDEGNRQVVRIALTDLR
jgi:hypothetical protein